MDIWSLEGGKAVEGSGWLGKKPNDQDALHRCYIILYMVNLGVAAEPEFVEPSPAWLEPRLELELELFKKK